MSGARRSSSARSPTAGFYTRRMSRRTRWRTTRDHPDEVEAMFETAIIERLERWIELAEAKLAGSDVHHLHRAGQRRPACDRRRAARARRTSPRSAWSRARSSRSRPGMRCSCTGYTNVTPWNTQREYAEDRDPRAPRRDGGPAREPGDRDLQHPRAALRLAPRHRAACSARTSRSRPRSGAQLTAPVGSTAVREAIEQVPAAR